MADSCTALRTMLGQQTPTYDETFLNDWKPLDSPTMGRHETEVWKQGTGDEHLVDRIEIGQPDLTNKWQRIDAGECESPCAPPRVNVSWGTTRTSHYMEQFRIQSPLMCLTQLRYQTRSGEQIAKIYQGLKKIVTSYSTDFMRVHAFDFAPIVKVAGVSAAVLQPDFVPDPTPPGNISGQLTTVNLGGAGNLPLSELTFPYLDYLTTTLGMEGYAEAGSGLPQGMYNLHTSDRAWFKLTNGNPSMKDMMALTDPQQASPLYKINQGVLKPFGNIAPTLDMQAIKFQHMGSGVLNRVFPYYNTATTTGNRRVVNPAYVNARYQLSFLWHPKAIRLYTPDFKKMHEMVPSVNSSMFGKWKLINPEGVMQYEQPDGTVCTINNDEQLFFYWLAALELGFQYVEPQLMFPILHLVDGSGKDSIVNSPVCGDAPQYVAQVTDNSQDTCQV